MSAKFERLVTLIFQVRSEQASQEEREELEQWLNSPDNKEWYEKLQDMEHVCSQLKSYDKIDAEAGLKKLSEKIDAYEKQKSMNGKNK